MNLRRALLLFAIVLGLAALAAGLSRPTDDADTPADTAPTTRVPAVSGPPAEVRFDATQPRRRAVLAGQAAEVYVEVNGAGQVAIPGLGVSAAAEPLTPARFDVLEERTGSYPIRFVPAGGAQAPENAGTLVVKLSEPEA